MRRLRLAVLRWRVHHALVRSVSANELAKSRDQRLADLYDRLLVAENPWLAE